MKRLKAIGEILLLLFAVTFLFIAPIFGAAFQPQYAPWSWFMLAIYYPLTTHKVLAPECYE